VEIIQFLEVIFLLEENFASLPAKRQDSGTAEHDLSRNIETNKKAPIPRNIGARGYYFLLSIFH
jgi:hypothetical protein